MSSFLSQKSANKCGMINEKLIKVIVVDDSAVIRGLIVNTLNSNPRIHVLGVASNGQKLIELLKTQQPTIILLDIIMPILDGLKTLPFITQNFSDIKVIMVSTLTKKNFNLTLKAMKLGACDYLTKPSCGKGLLTNEIFQQDLIKKIILHGSVHHSSAKFKPIRSESLQKTVSQKQNLNDLRLRPWPVTSFKIVAIGASTGGPQAILKIFENFDVNFRYPILIVQHMPAYYVPIFAKYLQRVSGIKVYEAEDGQEILSGCIYLAPGNYHMVVETSSKLYLRLLSTVPENFHRPSIDVLYKSLASLKNVLAIILTGMGVDGLKGCKEIVAKGGAVIAQDLESSVVGSMPLAVAQANLCSAIENPQNIRHILKQLQNNFGRIF